MDKKSSDLKRQRLHQKQVATVFLFVAVSVLFYWLSFRVFTGPNCDFFGSKLALVIVPACTALGNEAAAVIPFGIACALFFMAIRLYRQHNRSSIS